MFKCNKNVSLLRILGNTAPWPSCTMYITSSRTLEEFYPEAEACVWSWCLSVLIKSVSSQPQLSSLKLSVSFHWHFLPLYVRNSWCRRDEESRTFSCSDSDQNLKNFLTLSAFCFRTLLRTLYDALGRQDKPLFRHVASSHKPLTKPAAMPVSNIVQILRR